MFNKSTTSAAPLNSRLLPGLLDLQNLQLGRAVRVVDMGPAQGETIEFFSQFNCRLRVLDIVAELKSLNDKLCQYETMDEEIDEEEIRGDIQRALDLGDDEAFDICLFWDTLNYLHPRVLPIFSAVLLPHLSVNSRSHGFAVLNKKTPLREQNYAVINGEFLSVTHQKKTEIPYRHSQSTIKGGMCGIAIQQSILRADGRLEMLLNRI